jgi:hypothetical protein
MKTLIFIILKIFELSVICGAYLGFAKLGWLIDHQFKEPEAYIFYNPFYFIVGFFVSLCCGIIVFGIIILGKMIIEKNLEWAENINNKLK